MDERDNHVMVPSFISVSLRFEYGFIALSFGLEALVSNEWANYLKYIVERVP